MDETQKPTETDRTPEPLSALPNGVVVAGVHMPNRWLRLPFKLWIFGGAGLVVIVLALGVGYHVYTRDTTLVTPAKATKPAPSTPASQQTGAEAKSTPTAQPAQSTPATSPAKTSTKTPTQAPVATPPPAPAPWVNTTNCLPQNPTQYQTYYTGMTNSQYLQTNGYANTTKLYAGLQFAGLINTIDTKQYVVLAMDDSQWNFTQAQLDWMNASPANMKAVLGWQVITSCITYDGYNPTKDMAAGAQVTVNTLNGPVTYTQSASGLGQFGNGPVDIWDWFTSNGSVTIAGFVNTSALP